MHQVTHVDNKVTTHFLLNLKQEDDRAKAQDLCQRSGRIPGVNILDTTLDQQPFVLETETNEEGVSQWGASTHPYIPASPHSQRSCG